MLGYQMKRIGDKEPYGSAPTLGQTFASPGRSTEASSDHDPYAYAKYDLDDDSLESRHTESELSTCIENLQTISEVSESSVECGETKTETLTQD